MCIYTYSRIYKLVVQYVILFLLSSHLLQHQSGRLRGRILHDITFERLRGWVVPVDLAGLSVYVASCGCKYNLFLFGQELHRYIHICFLCLHTFIYIRTTHACNMYEKALDHQRNAQIILQHVSLGQEVWKGNLVISLVLVMH